MSQQHDKLSKQLKGIIKKMKKIQKSIGGSEAPPSMHELDGLTRLGEKYAKTVQKIARIDAKQKARKS